MVLFWAMLVMCMLPAITLGVVCCKVLLGCICRKAASRLDENLMAAIDYLRFFVRRTQSLFQGTSSFPGRCGWMGGLIELLRGCT